MADAVVAHALGLLGLQDIYSPAVALHHCHSMTVSSIAAAVCAALVH
jgi:hypothetical protein